MFQWVVIIFTLIGSFVLSDAIKGQKRFNLTPFAFASFLFMIVVLPGLKSVWHVPYICGKFLLAMFLLNGLPRIDRVYNASWKSFLLFYAYMYAIGFTGLYVLEMSSQYLQVLLLGFGVGFFLAAWCCRTEGSMRRVIAAVVTLALVVIVKNIFDGSFSSEMLDDQGRLMLYSDLTGEFGSSTEVNGIALDMDLLLPFTLLAMLSPMRIRIPFWLKTLGYAAFIGICLVIIRTGSRNGALGILPCLIYFVAPSPNESIRIKRIISIIAAMACLAVFVMVSMKGAETVRSVNYLVNYKAAMANNEQYFENKGDALTSGRFLLYRHVLESMTPLQIVFGAGYGMAEQATFVSKNVAVEEREYLLAHRTRVGAGNMHSVFMTVFFRTGIIGSMLFFIFVAKVFAEGRKMGGRGRMALLFFSIWLMTGLGESSGMTAARTSILAGFAMGLLGHVRITNSELMDNLY